MARTNDRRASGGTGAGQPRHADPASDGGRRLRTLAIVAVALGLAALTLGACLLSYDSVHALALQAGVKTSQARVYPFIGDATLVVAGCSVLALRGAGLVSRVYAWLCFVVLLAALAGSDVAHAAAMTVPARAAEITAAILPWALVLLAFGLLLALLRHVRRRRPSHRASGPAPTPAQPSAPPPGPVAPIDPTAPSMAEPVTAEAVADESAEGKPAAGEPAPDESGDAVPTAPIPAAAVPTAAVPTAAVVPAAPVPAAVVPAAPVPAAAVPIAPVPAAAVPIAPVPTTAVPIAPVPTTAVPTAAALASAALGKHAAPGPPRTGWPGPQPSVPVAEPTGWPDIAPSGSTFGEDSTFGNPSPPGAVPPRDACPRDAGPPGAALLPDVAPEPPPRIVARPVEMQLRARRQPPPALSATAESPAPTDRAPVIPPAPIVPPAPPSPPASERTAAPGSAAAPGSTADAEGTAAAGRTAAAEGATDLKRTTAPERTVQSPAMPPVMPPSGVAPPSGMSASRYGGDTIPKGQAVSSPTADQPGDANAETNPPAEAPVLDRPRSSPTPPTG